MEATSFAPPPSRPRSGSAPPALSHEDQPPPHPSLRGSVSQPGLPTGAASYRRERWRFDSPKSEKRTMPIERLIDDFRQAYAAFQSIQAGEQAVQCEVSAEGGMHTLGCNKATTRLKALAKSIKVKGLNSPGTVTTEIRGEIKTVLREVEKHWKEIRGDGSPSEGSDSE